MDLILLLGLTILLVWIVDCEFLRGKMKVVYKIMIAIGVILLGLWGFFHTFYV